MHLEGGILHISSFFSVKLMITASVLIAAIVGVVYFYILGFL